MSQTTPNNSIKLVRFRSLGRRYCGAPYAEHYGSYTMKIILSIILLSVSMASQARTWNEDMTCGNAQIKIQITEQEKGIKIWEVTMHVKSKFSRNESALLYFEQVYFNHQCQKTKSGKDYYVFQAYCSGSACHDKDNWGIIDDNAKLVLSPYKSNRLWKDQILNNN